MREDLLKLIDNTERIRDKFHVIGGQNSPAHNVIYNDADFSTWKREVQLELQDIFDRTHDQFVWDVLILTKQGFNGWKDEKSFNELNGSLQAIRKNIDKYYPEEKGLVLVEENELKEKKPKIFISHATVDKNYASALVGLLEDIGLRESQIFCSSALGYGIPLDEDIYEYLKKQFNEFDLHIILLLSDHYYESVASMNEMGAAWVLQKKYTIILLPGFQFKEIEGAINPRQIGMKLDNDLGDVKEKLGQLKDSVVEEFGLEPMRDVRWEQKRDECIRQILDIKPEQVLGKEAIIMLQKACNEKDGMILRTTSMEGVQIEVRSENFITSQERRVVALWESGLEELVTGGYVERQGGESDIPCYAKGI